MADEKPYFPAPRKPEPPYRAPATPAVEPATKGAVVVTRPDPLDVALRRSAQAAPARSETYWERHRTFARHPRLIGAVLVVAGSGLLWGIIDALREGASYRERGTVLAPVAVLAGLWSVVTGFPLQADGKPPRSWIVGLVACTAIGFLIGLALLAALSR